MKSVGLNILLGIPLLTGQTLLTGTWY